MILIIVGVLGTVLMAWRRDRRNWKPEVESSSSIVKIGLNTQKCPGDLRRLSITVSRERPPANADVKNSNDNIDRQYISRKEEVRGLISIEDSVDPSILRLENYVKKNKERLIQRPLTT